MELLTIASNESPPARKKNQTRSEAPSGIIGLETSLSLGITNLVKPGYLTMIQLLEKMTVNPAKLYLLTGHWKEYASKSSNSPFTGEELTGKENRRTRIF